MIVVVATEDDLTARAVVDALARLGQRNVFWLNLETAFDTIDLDFKADSTGVAWSIRSRSDPSLVIDRSSITSVYWRRPLRVLGSPFLGIPTSGNLDALELFWSVRWILECLPSELYPLNHPLDFQRAENKHRQMAAAVQIGFTIPTTCHSNNTEVLTNFIAAQKFVAVKAMRMPAVSTTGEVQDARHIACKSFDPEFLNERLRHAGRTQLYCQQTVQRSRDLRIMVFPHKIIAVEIDTSKLEANKLDWREHSLEVAHRIVPVDSAFEKQLRHFMRLMDIKAGYFDFAQPDAGPPVFFECNTNAGWVWIEKLTGCAISEVIARELMIQPA